MPKKIQYLLNNMLSNITSSRDVKVNSILKVPCLSFYLLKGLIDLLRHDTICSW